MHSNTRPQLSLYNYKSIITRVIDGDTVVATISLGLDVELKNQKLRLYGINTPELRGETKDIAMAARDYLTSLVLNKELLISTHRDTKEKYERYLAELWLPNSEKSINSMLIDAGHAVRTN